MPATEPSQSVVIYLTVKEGARAIEFYQKAFGAKELMRLAEPSGRVGHAEIQIGNTIVMLSDEYPEMKILGPQSLGGASAGLQLVVDDADAVFARALAAGATSVQPVQDQFYGYRSGKLTDPFGHVWYVATNKEHLTNQEMRHRYEKMMQQ